jgi:hypothetical protein
MQRNMRAHFPIEGPHIMQRLRDPEANLPKLSAVDPCRYVRQADLARLSGSRDEAVALIAQAYLAFDLLLPNCDDVTGWGKEW